MELVCFQGNDKQNWPQINALIKKGDWDITFLIKSRDTPSFPIPLNCKIINVNTNSPLLDLKKEIAEKLKASLGKELEVAVSMASGSGKENMATISALLSVPVGIRLVAFTKKGIEFIN